MLLYLEVIVQTESVRRDHSPPLMWGGIGGGGWSRRTLPNVYQTYKNN